MKPRLLRTLHHHQTGAAAIEFALVTPVLLFVLMGMLNLAQMVFGQAVLTGEVQTAARSGSLDGTSTTAAETKIKNALKPILVSVSGVTTSRQSYRDFSDIGRAEQFTDTNSNGTCNAGETYTDENGNGQWDSDIGKTGTGGPGDVITFTVNATYAPIFKMPFAKADWASKTLKAVSVRKNKAPGSQASYGTTMKTCS
ncbi:MAG: TadE/TadG family type IV pilus assembly protein [Novosphingobium sp.]